MVFIVFLGPGSNLNTALQGSVQVTSVSVTGAHTQQPLRVNNSNSNAVMVTVDPSRHSVHSTQQQQQATEVKGGSTSKLCLSNVWKTRFLCASSEMCGIMCKYIFPSIRVP